MTSNVPDYTNTQITNLINEYIHSEKYRGILLRRLVDGAKFEDLACEFDMSVRQCKRIVYNCMEIITKHI